MSGLRLGWLDSTVGDPRLNRLWALVSDQVRRQAGDRATVTLAHTDLSTGGVRSLPNRAMNDAAMLAAAIRTAEDVEALVVGCWASPTAAVRAAVGIPVTGLAEASVSIAPAVAQSAAVVTVAPSLVPVLERDIDSLGRIGLIARPTVRTWRPETTHDDLLAAIDEPGSVIDRFEAAAGSAVDDGADAIIVGCGYVAAIFAAHDYRRLRGRPGVPVVDCNAVAVEHVLMLASLDRSGVLPVGAPNLTESQRAGLDGARAAFARSSRTQGSDRTWERAQR